MNSDGAVEKDFQKSINFISYSKFLILLYYPEASADGVDTQKLVELLNFFSKKAHCRCSTGS